MRRAVSPAPDEGGAPGCRSRNRAARARDHPRQRYPVHRQRRRDDRPRRGRRRGPPRSARPADRRGAAPVACAGQAVRPFDPQRAGGAHRLAPVARLHRGRSGVRHPDQGDSRPGPRARADGDDPPIGAGTGRRPWRDRRREPRGGASPRRPELLRREGGHPAAGSGERDPRAAGASGDRPPGIPTIYRSRKYLRKRSGAGAFPPPPRGRSRRNPVVVAVTPRPG